MTTISTARMRARARERGRGRRAMERRPRWGVSEKGDGRADDDER